MPAPIQTFEMFGGKQRPNEVGTVTIEFEEIRRRVGDPFVRTVAVKGIVWPGPTTDRGSAPEPKSGWRVSMSKKASKRRAGGGVAHHPRNTGIVDAAKGHVMALELGGPDIPDNIVPQWAQWQGSGEWRKMEIQIRDRAKQGLEQKPVEYLMFHCAVGYLPMRDVEIGGLRRLCFPANFQVGLTGMRSVGLGKFVPIENPKIMFSDEQRQNDTDDMLGCVP